MNDSDTKTGPVLAAIGEMVEPSVLPSALSLNAMVFFVGGSFAVAKGGPFVMNSKAEIAQAVADFDAGVVRHHPTKRKLMKLLALSGSSSSSSINRTLLRNALSMLPSAVTVQDISVRDLDAPMFSVDLERSGGIPGSIAQLHAAINGSDAMLLASPEHNGSMPAMLKNAIDWLSRVHPGKAFLNTRLALISTSPGRRAGAGNLENIARLAPFWGATVVGTFSLPSFGKTFDSESSSLVDPAHREALSALLHELVTF